jgi:surfeit locus 1 family protein
LIKKQSDYSFKSKLIRVSLASVLMAFFLLLALWQFRRAEEVQFLLDQRLMAQQRPVMNYPDSEMMRSAHPEDQKVRLQGVFDADHQFLLDNQVVDGRAGYHVLTPFLMEGGAAILVDRGWVPLEADRSILPQVTVAHDKTEIIGELHGFFRLGLRLSASHVGPSTWPRVIPFEDLPQLDKALGYPLLPYQVLLSPESGPGYVRKWTNTLPDPNRNKGYAFQWLGMAVMTGLWFLFQFRTSKSY